MSLFFVSFSRHSGREKMLSLPPAKANIAERCFRKLSGQGRGEISRRVQKNDFVHFGTGSGVTLLSILISYSLVQYSAIVF